MTASAPRRTGSARPGADLLAHVAADLTGCRLERRSPTTAAVVPDDAGVPPFTVEVRRERRRLLDLQTLAVHVEGPPTAASGPLVVLHHTGQLRRTGLTAQVRGGRRVASTAVQEAERLRARLVADAALERVSLPLDFTRFEVRPHAGAWRATLDLMGASHVRTTLPPTARYVRLTSDQRDALLATVAALHERLPGTAPAR